MDLEKDAQIEETAKQPMPTEENSDAGEAKADDVDPNIIDFDTNDPRDPQNWPPRYQWSITTLLAIMSIIVLGSPLVRLARSPEHR